MSTPRTCRSAVSVLIVSWLTACADPADIASGLDIVRTDSAGVEIVLIEGNDAAVPVFATLDTLPSLRIGAVEGQPEEVFGTIADVLPLPDGGVAVLDRQAGDVRVFDAAGSHRMSFGGQGQGPGELTRPTELGLLPGDTLAVYDPRHLRITRFGPDGALGRITTLQTAPGRVTVASFLPDGRLVGQSRWLAPDRGPPPTNESVLTRDTAVIALYSSAGDPLDTIEILPSRETVTNIEWSGQSISIFRRPAVFGRTNLFAAHPDGVWSSTNDRFELQLLEAETGRLLRVVRAPGLERPATDEHERVIREQAFAGIETPAQRNWVEEWLELSPRPETLPAYDRMLVDERGRVWLRAWSIPEEAQRWWVFAADGDLLGALNAPNGITIMSVRCGVVWGVEQDALDVSYVVRYPVRYANGC